MPDEKAPQAPPEDLIPYQKMVPVIIDLQVLESHYYKRYQRVNMYKTALDSASYFVFERHAVTRDQFKRSYQYYSMDLQMMYLLLETTLDSINYRVNQEMPQ